MVDADTCSGSRIYPRQDLLRCRDRMLCGAPQGMRAQEGSALCHWPAREYQATCRSGQQVNARAAWGRNAQIESQGPLALLHDPFDDTHAMLLNLAQKYGFAEACCQAAHGG